MMRMSFSQRANLATHRQSSACSRDDLGGFVGARVLVTRECRGQTLGPGIAVTACVLAYQPPEVMLQCALYVHLAGRIAASDCGAHALTW
jgi:hypothetical protein